MSADEFWSDYEYHATRLDDLFEQVRLIAGISVERGRAIAWRGQASSEWGLLSQLHRKIIASGSDSPDEEILRLYEKKILTRLKDWGLHNYKERGKLSVLNQLATLQHLSSPTRFIDISFNAFVALFFACEFSEETEFRDARLFAINVTSRIINNNTYLRPWEDATDTPWSDSAIRSEYNKRRRSSTTNETFRTFYRNWMSDWTSNSYAWKPPAIEPRIAAQNGGFLFGSVIDDVYKNGYVFPSHNKTEDVQQKLFDNNFMVDGIISKQKAREITSVAFVPTRIDSQSMHFINNNAIMSIKIDRNLKQKLRNYLASTLGYSHATMYPDYIGFSKHEIPSILSSETRRVGKFLRIKPTHPDQGSLF